jgi:hypothetical protein
MDAQNTREWATRIGERIAILVENGYPTSRATQEYFKLIYFRHLNMRLLARYLTVSKLLGIGTHDQQVEKLKILGFKDHSLGSILIVNWEEMKSKAPRHLFFYEQLLSLSEEYEDLEVHVAFHDIVQHHCNATFLESSVPEYDCPADRDSLLARLSLNAMFLLLDGFKDFLGETFDDFFFDTDQEIRPHALLDSYHSGLKSL